LQLPQTQGALLLYKKYIEPFLVKNQAEIEADTKIIAQDGLAVLKKVGAEAFKVGSNYLSENPQVKQSVNDAITSSVKSELEKKFK
jgi:hypothetical protein